MVRSLVCPACRHGEPLTARPDAWECAHCGARFPLVAHLPVVAQPLAPFVRAIADSVGGDPASDRALVPFLPDDAPLARRLQRVSVAARAHWGDRLQPASDAAWRAFQPFLREVPRGLVVELGAGAGRVALELAETREVVAVDTDPAVLSLAADVQRTGEADVSLRSIGATYEPGKIHAPELRGRPVTFLLGDALDPPLAPGQFDAVVALNLLDNVRVPSTLVGQIDALLKPGGIALISTPYAWDSGLVDDGERIGGATGRPFGGDPVTELRRLLTADGVDLPWKFEITRDEPHVPWTLVRDARCKFVYDLHVVVARKSR